jgi:hypothetical protein
MKYIRIFIIFFIVGQSTFSQKRISDSELSDMKTKIENEIVEFKKQIDTEDYSDHLQNPVFDRLKIISTSV